MEGLLFVAGDEGLDSKQLAQLIELDEAVIIDLIHDMKADYKRESRGLQIIEVAHCYQFTTLPEHAPYFERLAYSPTNSTLSQAALETLAIIAYKQPISRADVEEIRGVKCEKAIHRLISKELVKEIGRTEGTGRAILYGTTKEFLEYFGLRSIEELPSPLSLISEEELEEESRDLFNRLQEDYNQSS
ncbi:MAG: SMC-Scp complex subunit ScpB [Bacilli bacterium]